MARMITIDCIGSNVLSITDGYAVHNVPLNSQVIHISEQSGENEYRLSQLPLNYKVATLKGRLNIHDGKGRLIYCWRSLEQYQRPWRSPSLGRQGGRRSRSPRGRAQAGVEMMTPMSSRASAHIQSGTSRPQCSTTASSPPSSTSKEYGPGPRPDLTSNSGDYDYSKLKREDASFTEKDAIDLTKDEKDHLTSAMTEEEKKILLQITNNLMRTKSSWYFRKPVKDDPRYFKMIKEPMDLRTLKHKLIDGDYASLQEYKRGFRLIIDNALQFNEPYSEIVNDALSLNAKFEEKVAMLSVTDMEDPAYNTTRNSATPASPESGPGEEPPRRTRKLRPRAAKLLDQTYRPPSLRVNQYDDLMHWLIPEDIMGG